MKFQITEVSLDAKHNVTVNGVYKDGKFTSAEKVFAFNLDTTPHRTKAEFLGEVKKAIEAVQPSVSAEEKTKLDKAVLARNLLTEYVGVDVTLVKTK